MIADRNLLASQKSKLWLQSLVVKCYNFLSFRIISNLFLGCKDIFPMKEKPNTYHDFQVKYEPQELGYDPGFSIAINASESDNEAVYQMFEHVQVKSEPAFLENDEPKFNSLASDTLHPELQSPGEERTTEYLSSSVFVECSTDEDVGNQLSSNSDINSTSGQMENTPNKNKKGEQMQSARL